MKKKLVQFLILCMMITLVSCGSKQEPDVSGDTTSESISEQESEASIEESASNEEEEKEESNEEKEDIDSDNKEDKKDESAKDKPDKTKPQTNTNQGTASHTQGGTQVGGQTNTQGNGTSNNQNSVQNNPTNTESNGTNIAQSVVSDFRSKVRGGNYSAGSMANSLLNNPKLDFNGATMSVSPGPLNGFKGNIKGFSEGAQFGPVIGTIPFIGYVFKLDSADNAQSFLRTLKSNADPNWNICTCADDTAGDAVGDMVVFVMSPREF